MRPCCFYRAACREQTISVTLSGAYTSVALQGKPTWISCTKSGSKFTLNVSRNTSTSSRRSDVVFRDGTKLWTLRVTQNGAPTVKVTLDPNGGTVSPPYVYVPVGGSYGSLPNPTKTGYTFQGSDGIGYFCFGLDKDSGEVYVMRAKKHWFDENFPNGVAKDPDGVHHRRGVFR